MGSVESDLRHHEAESEKEARIEELIAEYQRQVDRKVRDLNETIKTGMKTLVGLKETIKQIKTVVELYHQCLQSRIDAVDTRLELSHRVLMEEGLDKNEVWCDIIAERSHKNDAFLLIGNLASAERTIEAMEDEF